MKAIKGLFLLILSFVVLSVNAQTDNRKANISGVLYQLTFNIPENPTEKVNGKATITFDIKSKQDVVLDFQGTPGNVMVYKANKGKGKKASVKVQNDKIIIPAKMFKMWFTLRYRPMRDVHSSLVSMIMTCELSIKPLLMLLPDGNR